MCFCCLHACLLSDSLCLYVEMCVCVVKILQLWGNIQMFLQLLLTSSPSPIFLSLTYAFFLVHSCSSTLLVPLFLLNSVHLVSLGPLEHLIPLLIFATAPADHSNPYLLYVSSYTAHLQELTFPLPFVLL